MLLLLPVAQVSCKSLAGQSYEAAAAVLAAAAAEALSCCPGLLLLDDLELLTPAPNTEGPAGLEQVWVPLLVTLLLHSQDSSLSWQLTSSSPAQQKAHGLFCPRGVVTE